MSWILLRDTASFIFTNRSIIMNTYGKFEYIQFGFYVADKMGICDAARQNIKKKYAPTQYEIILVENVGVEAGKLGNFEILDIA